MTSSSGSSRTRESQGKSAAAFGTALHAGAERVATSLEVDPADPLAAWLNLYRDWFQANCVRVIWSERVLVNPELGYAGTADLLMEHQAHGLTLVDLKSAGREGGRRGRRRTGPGATSWRRTGRRFGQRGDVHEPDHELAGAACAGRSAFGARRRWCRCWRGFRGGARVCGSIEKSFDPCGGRCGGGGGQRGRRAWRAARGRRGGQCGCGVRGATR